MSGRFACLTALSRPLLTSVHFTLFLMPMQQTNFTSNFWPTSGRGQELEKINTAVCHSHHRVVDFVFKRLTLSTFVFQYNYNLVFPWMSLWWYFIKQNSSSGIWKTRQVISDTKCDKQFFTLQANVNIRFSGWIIVITLLCLHVVIHCVL